MDILSTYKAQRARRKPISLKRLIGELSLREELHYTFSVIPQKPLIVEQDLLVGIFKFSEQEGAKPLSYKGDMPTIIANLHSLNTTKEYTKIEAQKEKDEKLQRTIEKKGVGVYY